MIELPRRAGGTTRDAVERELGDHVHFLEGRYGSDWLDLPETLGRPLLRAETLLASGPAALCSTMAPVKASARALAAASAAAAISDLVQHEGVVLEQVLSTDLVDLPLVRLSAVVDAVLDLGASPRAEPTWASPGAAQAAEVVLASHGDVIREGARTHHAVYEQFTERIWDVPERRLKRGRRPWRAIAWFRLHRSFVATSRTLHAPSSQASAADLVLEGRAARAQLLQIAPLLASHLGEHDHGLMTDVDAALAALASVRRLQSALADRLDPERFARLLTADAFRSETVLEPTRNLRVALQAWTADISKLGGGDALAWHGPDLARWASRVQDVLPTLDSAAGAVALVGGPTGTLADLVNDLLARERFADLTASLPSTDAVDAQSGSAS